MDRTLAVIAGTLAALAAIYLLLRWLNRGTTIRMADEVRAREEVYPYPVEEVKAEPTVPMTQRQIQTLDRDYNEMRAANHRLTAELQVALSERDAAIQALAVMRERKDGAYTERNRVVAALAHLAKENGWATGLARTAIDGWDEEWHNCVYMDLGTGQLSWHYHDSHAWMFAGLPRWRRRYDGHTTPEKYSRLCKAFDVEEPVS
jgi:hypothetical protein